MPGDIEQTGRAMAEDDTTLRLREDGLNWREIDGEVVVLDLERSHYLNLNATGACSGCCWPRRDRASARRQADPGVRRQRVNGRADVEAFVTSCRRMGFWLITELDTSSGAFFEPCT